MGNICAFEGCLEQAVGDLQSDTIRVVGRVLPSSGESFCVRHLKQRIEWRRLEAEAQRVVSLEPRPVQKRRALRRR